MSIRVPAMKPKPVEFMHAQPVQWGPRFDGAHEKNLRNEGPSLCKAGDGPSQARALVTDVRQYMGARQAARVAQHPLEAPRSGQKLGAVLVQVNSEWHAQDRWAQIYGQMPAGEKKDHIRQQLIELERAMQGKERALGVDDDAARLFERPDPSEDHWVRQLRKFLE